MMWLANVNQHRREIPLTGFLEGRKHRHAIFLPSVDEVQICAILTPRRNLDILVEKPIASTVSFLRN
jgi:hypothetical protein